MNKTSYIYIYNQALKYNKLKHNVYSLFTNRTVRETRKILLSSLRNILNHVRSTTWRKMAGNHMSPRIMLTNTSYIYNRTVATPAPKSNVYTFDFLIIIKLPSTLNKTDCSLGCIPFFFFLVQL